ncbi:cytochrome c3 family protein [uncultured Aquimarina sp.]|uniref:cytochrome c3 family protein n=1 Tax=uncultured Aquimarina sp. TaxID=575652 RepID=UPI0026222AB9|nr:cytochrome c3 family protein [uncultured Aquimarina sp.]
MISKKSYIYVLGGLFIMMLLSCKHGKGEYHSLTDKIEAESKNYHGTSISSESYIGDMETIEIIEGEHTFLIPERKSQITSFECAQCHTKPLKELKGVDVKKAHWDINLVHAKEKVMNCATCHNGNDMNNLQSLTGTAIDFNRSYQLCAQCHSSQFEDWKGGAHGKNIGGWSIPRAAMTCVNCHNPHKPKIESRWPSRFNTQKVKERE